MPCCHPDLSDRRSGRYEPHTGLHAPSISAARRERWLAGSDLCSARGREFDGDLVSLHSAESGQRASQRRK